MSKVLHLEIIFAVINKIPSRSFGAYYITGWVGYISEFSFIPHFSADLALYWTSHFIPANYCILYIFKQERYILIEANSVHYLIP